MHALLRSIDRLYEAAVEPELWPLALDEISGSLGGIGASSLPLAGRSRPLFHVTSNLAEAADDYLSYWWKHDSWVAESNRRGNPSGVWTDELILSSHDTAADPFYQEFLKSIGCGSFLVLVSRPVPGLVLSISVQRALNAGPVSSATFDRACRLLPHACRAASIAFQLDTARSRHNQFLEILNSLEVGAALVGRDGRLHFANTTLVSLSGCGLTVGSAGLRAQRADDQHRLDRFVASLFMPDASVVEPLALRRPDGRLPLLVQGMRLPASTLEDEVGRSWRGEVALLVVVDLDRQARERPDGALRALGLTPAEARVAALLGAGLSTEEIADRLSIEKDTVRTQLKRIYAKIGVARQAELAAVVARLSVLRPDP